MPSLEGVLDREGACPSTVVKCFITCPPIHGARVGRLGRWFLSLHHWCARVLSSERAETESYKTKFFQTWCSELSMKKVVRSEGRPRVLETSRANGSRKLEIGRADSRCPGA